MSLSPLDTLNAAIAAIESKNIDAIMSLIDETCTISRENNVVIADGHDAIRSFYSSAIDSMPNFRVELRENFTVGSVLMAHEVNTRVVNDEETSIGSVWAYQIRNGKFMLMHVFDPADQLQTLLSSVD